MSRRARRRGTRSEPGEKRCRRSAERSSRSRAGTSRCARGDRLLVRSVAKIGRLAAARVHRGARARHPSCSLLAGRAPRHPDAYGRAGPARVARRGRRPCAAPRRPRAHGRSRDMDEQISVEGAELVGVVAGAALVAGEVADPHQHHAPLDAPVDGHRLVLGEVDAESLRSAAKSARSAWGRCWRARSGSALASMRISSAAMATA